METFLILLLAHLLGDFPLQTNRIFRMKLAGILGLIIHVAIHLIAAILLIPSAEQYWMVLLVLGVSHFITDWSKVRLQHPNRSFLPGFLIDQGVHIVVIILLSIWQPNIPSILPQQLLIILLLFATLPAILMTVWVWANDTYVIKKRVESKKAKWLHKHTLLLSQRVGWIVVGCVAFSNIVMNV